jgi:hypothetical protein
VTVANENIKNETCLPKLSKSRKRLKANEDSRSNSKLNGVCNGSINFAMLAPTVEMFLK